MKTTDCCLEELLDQFRGHSNSEPTGSPECPTQEERRRWEEERAVRARTARGPGPWPASSPPPLLSDETPADANAGDRASGRGHRPSFTLHCWQGGSRLFLGPKDQPAVPTPLSPSLPARLVSPQKASSAALKHPGRYRPEREHPLTCATPSLPRGGRPQHHEPTISLPGSYTRD